MSNTAACSATLAGWIEGDTWTRWRVAGEGQVRFWLKPTTWHVGCGDLLCAVPVRTAADLRAACEMLAPGAYVELTAQPCAFRSMEVMRDESRAIVVFLAREACVVGFPLSIRRESEAAVAVAQEAPEPLATHHAPRHTTGKMAAAGDQEDSAA